ncbi:polysaccharide deacetylase family protein [Corynebacterium cystitidis]|uniref:polysaccharide deacetylase family protein n=1 Tax=Corynebacterium cystitidis TaxID=35757 RepID=UPI00211DB040|nr:polysaccharide deacetylase family protein [Corynebacterium cystitidis]
MVLNTKAGQEASHEITGKFDFAGKDFSFTIDAGDHTKIDSMLLYAHTSDDDYHRIDIAKDMRTFRAGGDNVVTATKFNIRPQRGNPDWSNINKIKLEVKGKGKGGDNTVTFKSMSTIPEADSGVVSVVFDDGWLSAYETAWPAMQEHGITKGVSYIIPDQVGDGGRMSLDQIKELQDIHGWDIGSHGSPRLTDLNTDQLKEELSGVKKYMEDNGIGRGARHYAYPQGRYDQSVLDYMRREFDTARTIEHDNESVKPGDPHRLRVFYAGAHIRSDQVQNAVDKAKENKTWLIMVYHRVEEPSNGAPETVTTSNFKEHMRILGESGLPIKTVREVWEDN